MSMSSHSRVAYRSRSLALDQTTYSSSSSVPPTDCPHRRSPPVPLLVAPVGAGATLASPRCDSDGGSIARTACGRGPPPARDDEADVLDASPSGMSTRSRLSLRGRRFSSLIATTSHSRTDGGGGGWRRRRINRPFSVGGSIVYSIIPPRVAGGPVPPRFFLWPASRSS